MKKSLVIHCHTHGEEPWDGEVICPCGVVHKIEAGAPKFTCVCGRDVKHWRAICRSCYAQKIAAFAQKIAAFTFPESASQEERDALGHAAEKELAEKLGVPTFEQFRAKRWPKGD